MTVTRSVVPARTSPCASGRTAFVGVLVQKQLYSEHGPVASPKVVGQYSICPIRTLQRLEQPIYGRSARKHTVVRYKRVTL
jgi:hypothetical protein